MYFEIIDVAYYMYTGDSLKSQINSYIYKNVIRTALIMLIKHCK